MIDQLVDDLYRSIYDTVTPSIYPSIIITEGVGFVKCVLPREPVGKVFENFEYVDIINTLLFTKEEIKVSDVMDYLNVSRSTSGRILTKFMNDGYLKKIGKGSATRYIKT